MYESADKAGKSIARKLLELYFFLMLVLEIKIIAVAQRRRLLINKGLFIFSKDNRRRKTREAVGGRDSIARAFVGFVGQ